MYVEDGEPGGPIVLRLGAMVKVGETVREFESSLERIVSERTGPLVLDLSDLEYMDSTTLGVLVGALHRLKSENREMVLVNPRDRIASLLRVAKLDSLFSIYGSVPEAIAAITRREKDTDVN